MSHKRVPKGKGENVLLFGSDFYTAKIKDIRIGVFILNIGSQAYVTVQRPYMLGKRSDLGCTPFQPGLGQVP